ncbi:MAG: restriction endonuclease subunit S [Aphanizomenon gracile PMC649.10]|nr:restriction endonuclease subunit S [Aphanizomenon gracile PMC649.10]
MSKFYKGKTSKLIDLCESITDCHHSTPKWTNEGKIVIRNFNIKNGKLLLDEISYTDEATYQERISRIQPYPGDLIITREAPMGEVCIIPDGIECCLGQRLVLIKPNLNKINNKYLLYALLCEYTQKQIKQSNNTGSIVSNLRIPLLKNLDIPLNNNQDKIASVLSAIDEKIELNNCINSELENLAKTIYNYWFVQFDFPDENGKPYKSSGGKMVYNKELKREIPAGWEVGTLQDWIDFKRGISYKSTEIQDTGIPLLNLNSFTLSGKFKPDGTKYFNGSFKEDSRLNYGDLVIAITDVTRNAIIIGKSFIVPDLFDQPPLISCDVASVISKSDFNNYYLEMLFNSELYHEYIKHFASGTLVLHLNLNGMLWFKTFMPQKTLLDKFAKIKKSIIAKQTNNVIENQQLTQLRDWLLPMLMNGQISIK